MKTERMVEHICASLPLALSLFCTLVSLWHFTPNCQGSCLLHRAAGIASRVNGDGFRNQKTSDTEAAQPQPRGHRSPLLIPPTQTERNKN